MKSEPDRLDLLIVILPIVLIALLTLQIFRFVQVGGDRESGVTLAQEVVGMTAPPAAPPPPSDEAPAEAPAAADAEPTEAPAEDAAGTTDADIETEPGAAEPEAGDPEAEAIEIGSAPEAAPPEDPLTGGAPADAGVPAGASPGSEPRELTAAGRDRSSPPSSPGGSPGAGGFGVTGSTQGQPGALVLTQPPAGAGDGAAADPAPDDPRQGGGTPGPAGPRTNDDDPPVDPNRAAILEAVPRKKLVSLGQVIPVEIRISGAFNVGSVPFHLSFNPVVLALNDSPQSQQGPFLDGASFLIAPGGPGEVVVGLSLLGATTGRSGDGLLATIYFRAIGMGQSPLAFTNASVRAPDASLRPASFVHSSIQVRP